MGVLARIRRCIRWQATRCSIVQVDDVGEAGVAQ
jgi:hypothetical protein